MTQIAIISGTSRGIGKGILQALLNKNVNVITINRHHQNFEHKLIQANLVFDLKQLAGIPSLVEEIKKLPKIKTFDQFFLFNNAAMIGDIGPMDQLETETIKSTMNLNLMSPMLLSLALINAFSSDKIQMKLVHISSGAAFSPIQGMGPYCISKAGLEMMSGIISEEYASKNISSITIGPGVVDTGMQTQLREAKPDQFKRHEDFVQFKEQGQLQDPDFIGQRISDFVIEGNYHSGKYYEINDL